MNNKLEYSQDALDKIDATENDENDRMDEADKAIAAMKQMTEEEQTSFARKEFDRFRDWLKNRIKNYKYKDEDGAGLLIQAGTMEKKIMNNRITNKG